MRCCVALVAAAALLGAVAHPPLEPAHAAEKEKSSREWKVPDRAAAQANPVPADDQSLQAGKKLYARECLDCHGGSGRGDGPGARDLEAPMPDLTRPKMWQQSDGAIFYKITEGREPMPSSQELSDQQRWHLVNYVRTLAPRPRDERDDDAQPAKGK